MKTAIVILNWNTKEFLGKFLPGLLASVKSVDGAEVIVADNASTDGSAQFMKDNFPDVRTIVFNENLGFTGGYNKAFEEIVTKAGAEAPEYFLLINSDIEVTDGWLEPLVEWMDNNPKCGACAPKLRSWHQKNMFEYAGAAGGHIDSFGYPFCRGRVLGKVEQDLGQYDHFHPEVFWASGACLMIRSSVYSETGGLDGRFFAHMEEIDLCWRMQLSGYNVCIVSSSVVYHIGGGTLPASSPFKLFLNFRNNMLMLNNNLAKTYALKHYKKSGNAAKAAAQGSFEASYMIRVRMVMDLMAAAAYLLTFRVDAFKAVLKAHNDYRKLRQQISAESISAYLRNNPDAEVRHIYGKWIVLQSLRHGSSIFSGIHETDFFKF